MNLAYLALFMVVVTACANPDLSRRHAHASHADAGEEQHVAVSVFVAEVPAKDARATLATLTDRGQEALIAAVATKTGGAGELLGALGEKLGKSPGAGLVIDRTRFQRRLVLSAERDGKWEHHPADRIQYLRFDISNLTNAELASWDKFSTEYADVDLGSVSLSQSVSGGAELAAGPAAGAGVPVSGTANVAASRTLTEEMSLRQRRISLTGILHKQKAVLIQEGVVGIDLAGNAVVDIEVRAIGDTDLESVVMIPALKEKGLWLSQDKIDVGWSYLRVPVSTNQVTFDYKATYVVRHVGWWGRSIVEGDDWATLVEGTTAPELGVVLVSADDLKVRVWHLENGDREPIEFEGIDGGTLRFASFEAARESLNWLRHEGSKAQGQVQIGNRDLATASGPVRASHIRLITVQVDELN